MKIEKQLLYDRHTLEDNYEYRKVERSFQWDKIAGMIDSLLNFENQAKKGHSFKDLITPRMSKYHNKYFEFDGKYGRVLYLSNYPGFLKDEFVSELCDLTFLTDADFGLTIA